jgi:outer membrane protein OmpA-like peptidoglycan-associated protein
LKQICLFFLFLLAYSISIHAQEIVGIVMEADSTQSPFYQAGVKISQAEKIVFEGKTYFDGRFKYKGIPNQDYLVTASYIGYKDSSVLVKIDNNGKVVPNDFKIALKKDGLRLSGYLMGRDNDEAIRDAGIILKNVMTRQEEKIITGIDGSYNFRLEYETNYLVRVDKRSAGIMNTYQDTSFYISTIGFNQPLDFKLNIKLGPSLEYVKARAEYDPKQKPQNKNIKPAIEVYGAKDSAKLAQQALVIAGLNRELFVKDSIIANLDKKIEDIKKNEAPVLVSNEKQEDKKTQKKNDEIEKQRREREKILADTKAKEMERIAKENAEKEKQEAARIAIVKANELEQLRLNELKKAEEAKAKKSKEAELLAAKEKQIELNKQKELIQKNEAKKITELSKKELAKADKQKIKDKKELEKQQIQAILKQEKDKVVAEKAKTKNEKVAAKEMALKAKYDAKVQKLQQTQQLELEKLAKKNADKKQKEVLTASAKRDKKERKMNGGEVFYQAKDSFLTDQQIRDKQQRIYLEEKRKQEQNDKATLVKKLEDIQRQQQDEIQSREQYESAQKDLMESYERKLKGEKEPIEVKEKIATPSIVSPSSESNIKAIPSKIKVNGVVYDGGSNLPLSNTSLTVRMLNTILSQELKSDEKGNYSFDVDSGSFYLVSFYKPGYILGKQLLDVTAQKDKTFRMSDFSIIEADDFDPSEKMPIVSFAKNSSATPFDLLNEVIPIVKMMKEIPQLRIKIYGMASFDEAYPKELSLTRAQEVAKVFINNNVPASRIKFNGYGNTKTKSGCTASSDCDEFKLSRDRIVLYKVVKD